MDILSPGNNPSNFGSNTFTNDNSNVDIRKEPLINDNKADGHIFRLNPLLNESLNNLVKRFERTKIPKPPPTKGQSIRKKSKLSNSLPNIFLPPGFDDYKYSNNEKKVQWTNKLNLNLEKLKNAFCDTYNLWCEQQRSQSITNLENNSSEKPNNDLNKDADLINTSLKHSYFDRTSINKPSFDRPGTIISADKTEFVGKLPYSTHVYLDGAIIEPISPASPSCSTSAAANIDDKGNKRTVRESEIIISNVESDVNIKPVVKKKGRPKKIQKIPTKSEETKEFSVTDIECVENVKGKSSKAQLKKTPKKSNKKNEQPVEGYVSINDDIEKVQRTTVNIELMKSPTKNQSSKKLKRNSSTSEKTDNTMLSQTSEKDTLTSNNDVDDVMERVPLVVKKSRKEEAILTRKQKELSKQNIENPGDTDEKPTVIRKKRNISKSIKSSKGKSQLVLSPTEQSFNTECDINPELDDESETIIKTDVKNDNENVGIENFEGSGEKGNECANDVCDAGNKGLTNKKLKLSKQDKANKSSIENSTLTGNVVEHVSNLFEKFNSIQFNEQPVIEKSSANKDEINPNVGIDVSGDLIENLNSNTATKKARKLPKQIKFDKGSNEVVESNILPSENNAGLISDENSKSTEETDRVLIVHEIKPPSVDVRDKLEAKKLNKKAEKPLKTKKPRKLQKQIKPSSSNNQSNDSVTGSVVKNLEESANVSSSSINFFPEHDTVTSKQSPKKARMTNTIGEKQSRPILSDLMDEFVKEFQNKSEDKSDHICENNAGIISDEKSKSTEETERVLIIQGINLPSVDDTADNSDDKLDSKTMNKKLEKPLKVKKPRKLQKQIKPSSLNNRSNDSLTDSVVENLEESAKVSSDSVNIFPQRDTVTSNQSLKKAGMTNTITEKQSRPMLSDLMDEFVKEFQNKSEDKPNPVDINVVTKNSSITGTDQEMGTFEKSVTKESPKKVMKMKPGPKSKKQFLSHIIADEGHRSESIPIEKSKLGMKYRKKGRLKNKLNDEYTEVGKGQSDEVERVTEGVSENEESRRMTADIPKNKIISIADNVIIKSDAMESIDQSNDIEVLSKSIADSVDTSMLPPRKRYKRLMYLDNSKHQTSPTGSLTVEDSQIIGISYVLGEDSIPQDEQDGPIKKVANNRSRFKRKKPKKNINDISEEDYDIESPPLLCDENAVSVEKHLDRPSSLKRSKREAAARGFANMVAMSLNNSSQSHETSSDITKKSTSNKTDSEECISTDVSGNKIFKRPRKSSTTNIGNTKTKGKLSKSFQFTDELDNDVDETETTSSGNKKSRISSKEMPPSPGDTIISNDSSSVDTSGKYRKIRTNIYTDSKSLRWLLDVEKCGCKPTNLKPLFDGQDKSTTKQRKSMSTVSWDCADDCLNRLAYSECNPKACPCKELCNNQRIRKMDWATCLKVTDFQTKGRGVLTTKSIPEGMFVVEYIGEVINEATFQDRLMGVYKDDVHHYCIHLDGDLLIDAYRCGSIARFINHSCQPNCEIQKWFVNGTYRMCLIATEDIEPDTELTFDYNFCSLNTKTTQMCVCGAANCRGFIGGRPRPEQTDSGKDRKKMFVAFGRVLSTREKAFVKRRSIFLVRSRILGRNRLLGVCCSKQTHGVKLPSVITDIKRRKSKKNQFLTQISALNSIKSVRMKLIQNVLTNEPLTRSELLTHVLRDLYNTILEQTDPVNPKQQLVAPFINRLLPTKYPEFYNMVGHDSIVSLSQVYCRLLNSKYTTMMAFDQDILQMIQNIELYAGKQSNIGKCAEHIKPVYKDLKMNSIGLYEALTEELVEEKEKNKLMSNNLTQVSNAVKSLSNSADNEPNNDAGVQPKTKKRKQGTATSGVSSRSRLERGAEVIKCVCGFLIEAGHVMVQCDRCFVWQHAYCMNVARSAELVDVTRMDPYFCHICLNIEQESLVREIPRHFVITDETVDSGNTLFWTLLHRDNTLLKIDDFVYIPTEEETNSDTMSQKMDLSKRTIMRIYSLWKDATGQRWMEGGLFFRPYNAYFKSLSETKLASAETSNKRKLAPVMDLSTHKWHQQEVVYTDLTKILPLEVCIGRCHVLNNHTFRLGKPLVQNNGRQTIDDVYVCDWLINKSGEWSEIDPAYMKINTKPYCFERYSDGNDNNEKFIRQYSAEDLLKFDQEAVDAGVVKVIYQKDGLDPKHETAVRSQFFDRLITKLSEFAQYRNRKLSLSPPSSVSSRSVASSRAPSPPCENVIANSSSHHSRKQLCPKRTMSESLPKITSIASDYSEGSPKLMIVVDDERTPKDVFTKVHEELSSTDDKSSEPKENFDDLSNPCSEIKYGDLLDLFKESGKCVPKSDKGSRIWSKKGPFKGKKKTPLKKNVLKPVSEIGSVDDNWVPTRNRQEDNAPRRETRSRKIYQDFEDETTVSKEKRSRNVEEETNVTDDGEEGPKTCFVKLERIRVSKMEKKKLKRIEKEENDLNASKLSNVDMPGCSQSSVDDVSISELADSTNDTKLEENSELHQTLSSLSSTSNNRSKRKKGVPKRIPFDFAYQNIDATKPVTLPFDYEVVDLSAGKTCHSDKPEETTVECQQIESPELVGALSKATKPNLTAIETRHIQAANDFSSIENISSN